MRTEALFTMSGPMSFISKGNGTSPPLRDHSQYGSQTENGALDAGAGRLITPTTPMRDGECDTRGSASVRRLKPGRRRGRATTTATKRTYRGLVAQAPARNARSRRRRRRCVSVGDVAASADGRTGGVIAAGIGEF